MFPVKPVKLSKFPLRLQLNIGAVSGPRTRPVLVLCSQMSQHVVRVTCEPVPVWSAKNEKVTLRKRWLPVVCPPVSSESEPVPSETTSFLSTRRLNVAPRFYFCIYHLHTWLLVSKQPTYDRKYDECQKYWNTEKWSFTGPDQYQRHRYHDNTLITGCPVGFFTF